MALRLQRNTKTTRLQPRLWYGHVQAKWIERINRFEVSQRPADKADDDAVKAITGTTLNAESHRPLFGISNFYVSTPNGRLLGDELN